MRRSLPAILCIAASIGMMAYGFSRGEAAAVLKKAIILCLECIGIG
jgi:hypothetical protein